jgi:hypothetical protein
VIVGEEGPSSLASSSSVASNTSLSVAVTRPAPVDRFLADFVVRGALRRHAGHD